MFLFQIEIPRDIEPEINIPFPPGACRLRQELGWNYTLRIGEHQLEYVPAGLDVPAQRKGIVDRIGDDLVLWHYIILRVDAHPPGELHPTSKPDGEDVVLVLRCRNEIVMQIGR